MSVPEGGGSQVDRFQVGEECRGLVRAQVPVREGSLYIEVQFIMGNGYMEPIHPSMNRQTERHTQLKTLQTFIIIKLFHAYFKFIILPFIRHTIVPLLAE